jgi:hypothetical protein
MKERILNPVLSIMPNKECGISCVFCGHKVVIGDVILCSEYDTEKDNVGDNLGRTTLH